VGVPSLVSASEENLLSHFGECFFFGIICSALLQGTADIAKCTHKPAKEKFVSLHSKVM
jgi:hypothetical protein